LAVYRQRGVVFGALFLGYTVYRTLYPAAFRIAGAETEVFQGSVNLLLLLTSSVTIMVAVDASRQGMRRTVIACLALTMLLGAAFLIFKGLEYSADIARGLFPGAPFPLQPPQTQLFWAFYWVMTGVHAIHLATGISIVGVFALMLWRRLLPIEVSRHSGRRDSLALRRHSLDHSLPAALPVDQARASAQECANFFAHAGYSKRERDILWGR
jgi:heme/copper-type cytochrome/quinol oxidase subunit 3